MVNYFVVISMFVCSIKSLILPVNSFMVQEYWQANKQVKQLRRYTISCAAFVVLAFYLVSIPSCTKPEDPQPIVVDTLPAPPSGPTGIIKDFSIQDSLIGHGRQTVIKWYVEGTNSLTEVRLNGEKVMFSGAMQSGPLSQNTVFTLTVNNNKQASKMVYVADSIATLLWNDGKRWRTIGTRTLIDTMMKGSAGQDSSIKVWQNTFDSEISKKYEHFRTSFYLDGNSKEEQVFTNFPKPNPSGTYKVVTAISSPDPGTGFGIQWKTRTYFIDTLSLASKELVLFVDTTTTGGKRTFNRIRYTPEF
jgi:hypothetical protein